LLRTDSTDSASSLSSTSSDVCRCDDCLLGIADLYISSPEEEARTRKKVGQFAASSSMPINTSKGELLLYVQPGLTCWLQYEFPRCSQQTVLPCTGVAFKTETCCVYCAVRTDI
jgi:hypothetical protein